MYLNDLRSTQSIYSDVKSRGQNGRVVMLAELQNLFPISLKLPYKIIVYYLKADLRQLIEGYVTFF